MEPDELIYQEYWDVLQKIKKIAYFTPILSHVVFGRVSDIEKGVLLDLQDEGAIKLLNLTRITRPIGFASTREQELFFAEDIKLFIKQPKFDEVYKYYKQINSSKLEDVNTQDATKSFKNNEVN